MDVCQRNTFIPASKLLATVIDRAVTYSHADHLSGRVESSSTGTVMRTYGNLPFGETWYETGAASKLKFTSYERDSESGLDYAVARQDSSRLGRFLSPDPLAGSIADPQSLNRYAYSRNDPVNLVDPTGMLYGLVCDIPGCGGGPGAGDFTFYRDVWSLTDRDREGIQDSLNRFLYDRGNGGVERSSDSSGCGKQQLRLCFGEDILNRRPGNAGKPANNVLPPADPCTSANGRAYGPGHYALDYRLPGYGTAIPAPENGTVTGGRSGSAHIPGPYDYSQVAPQGSVNFTQFSAESGYVISYVHVHPAVPIGTSVEQGTTIGMSDNSGRITGPHTHVQVIPPGGTHPIDPNTYFTGCQ